MDSAEVSRLMARANMCRENLHKAKGELAFWSRELRYAIDALAVDQQFDFKRLDSSFSEVSV